MSNSKTRTNVAAGSPAKPVHAGKPRGAGDVPGPVVKPYSSRAAASKSAGPGKPALKPFKGKPTK